jgi:hypothetical protein
MSIKSGIFSVKKVHKREIFVGSVFNLLLLVLLI